MTALDAAIATSSSAAFDPAFDEHLHTEFEKRPPRRVGDTVPRSAYIVAVVELFERFCLPAITTLSDFFIYGKTKKEVVACIVDAIEAHQNLGRSEVSMLFPGIY
ncbi:uncharacterized protein THITE_2090002 [Thermothielavioides terrestris NRRL 8126]|uniref:Uncharacterized protein n=1 Tax=Thermothielavioides terrestris (strain ATCC 38088 / NRRL 8126) TaxID=578455 RepID=G2R6K9_THETT|nr:uncharacterized protein THITE_2090002 [Thermothielavioides terrestris NRRL 8126]AEO68490.1 hypothetical protein THITE_2090002 [Thermothielavioides terrestris NRRL 8126]